jgi:ornithine decarboxylase
MRLAERPTYLSSEEPLSRPTIRTDDGRISSLIAQHGSPLLLIDCDVVRRQYRRLAAALPGVQLHYAIKAFPHPAVISALWKEGSSFDASSSLEIRTLLSLGVPPQRWLHTHPIKRPDEIREAIELGCRSFVVDNAAEIKKLADVRGRATGVLRIGFRSSDAGVDLSRKFGCHVEDALGLLELGHRLEVPITGLAFHVGSQCATPGGHVKAIADCLVLAKQANEAGLPPIQMLDIGGGFPARYDIPVPEIEEFCAPIREAISAVPGNMRVVAEPGRFLVASAGEGVATIVGKTCRDGAPWYYLDDGVYGSFNGVVYDVVRYPLTVLSRSTGECKPSVLAGPTCDSIDIIADGVLLPELEIGDIVVGAGMGAYTAASASEFNSIPRTKVVILNPLAPSESSQGTSPEARGVTERLTMGSR